MSVGSDALLERDAELAFLSEHLADVERSGEGRVVFVAGEAGVGKTTLVRRLETTVPVLVGACEPLFAPRPLGALLEIAPGDTPYDVVTELTQRLRSATVLVLEDVHWADEATLDVLRLLARRIESLPLLVVATYRDDELDRAHPLRIVIGDLVASERVDRVKVRRLSRGAVAELAAPHGVDPDELYRKTSGNPFFVAEALAAGTDGVPDTVRDAVLARAARLSPDARALVEAVAIVPPSADLHLLSQLAGETTAALDECLGSGMLASTGAGIAFRHELARLAVEEATSPDRSLALHRRALEVLDDPSRRAHHAEAAGDVDAVLRFAPEAAERAAAHGAHREAAGQYARALRFGDRLPRAARAELLERRSRACYLTDRSHEAIEAIEQALALRRELGQRLEEGDDLRWLAEILWCPGRVAEAEWAGRAAVALLEELPPGSELAHAYLALADRHAAAAHAREALVWAERAAALAEQVGDTDLVVHARTTIGSCEAGTKGTEALERNLGVALELGLERHASHIYVCLSGFAAGGRRFEMLPIVEAGLAYTGERGIELYRHYLLADRARLELASGRWDAAAETAAAVLRVPRTSATPRIHALVVLALVRARRGDPGVHEALDEAWRLAESTRELPRVAPVVLARAEVAWLEGQPADPPELENLVHYARELDAGLLVDELEEWRLRGEGGTPDWRAAAERWRGLGCPYEAALALADADAEAPLRQALEELQALGAQPAAALVARRLRALGVRGVRRGPRPTTRENPAGLTARELDVLALVAHGRTNTEIAARLVLSPRTVEHHVAAILRKLGVATRGDAGGEARRLGLQLR